MIRIAVTATEYDKARDVFSDPFPGYQCLRAPVDEPLLVEFIREQQVRHAIVGVGRYGGSLYPALQAGGVIARFGVGHDGINKELATLSKLLCTNTPGTLNQSVAEYTMSLLLAAARHIPRSAQETRQGGWKPILGREIRGRQLTIIGTGNIGRRVGEIATRGFEMHVVGCGRRARDHEDVRRTWPFAEYTDDYDSAVAEADFVSLHLPGGPGTVHYMDARRLACMAPRAWLINTARGSVVDEAALFNALAAGRPAGAALDVFEHEPYTPVAADKDLRTLDNVIMMPHAASSTSESCTAMARRALHNIMMAEEGNFGEMDLLNPQVLPDLEESK